MRRVLSLSTPLGVRFPWRTRWVVVLLVATVGSSAFGLAEIALGIDAALALMIVAIAIGLGWAVAAVPMSGQAALGIASLTGIAVLTVRIGHIGRQLLAIPVEFAGILVESIRLGEIAPSAPLVTSVSELVLDIGVLYGRVWLWLRTLVTDQWIVDPVASAFIWSALVWGAAAWAAWSVRRRSEPLVAILPMLTLLGISYAISRARPSAFVVPLGGALLLMAFTSHDARTRQWDEDQIDSPEGKTSSLAIIVLPIAVILTTIAALTQSFSLIRIVNVVEGIAGGRGQDDIALADSLGLSRGQAGDTGLETVLIPGLPNRHLIGSGPELSEQTVMEVTVTNLPLDGSAPSFRWRALTYDQYQGRGWQTSSLILEDYSAGEPVIEPDASSDLVVRQWVLGVGDLGGFIYSAGSPAVLDQPFQVAWRHTGEDAFTLTADVPLYQVESILTQASQTELRAQGTKYPDWVLESYLGLPEDLPDRVLALARDLTATSATPYDRALAIESYLRAFPYTLDVPELPLDRDVVDYFLFDLQRGYCDYYASSMVVLARAAGLPARLVVGYATGTPQQTEGTIRYIVTEAEAHSWVEVYFPEIGWVEFEPTGGRTAIERSDATVNSSLSDFQNLELAQRPRFRIQVNVSALVGSALLSLAVAWIIWVIFIDPLRLRRRAPAEALATLYNRLRRLTSPLGIESPPSDTPHEFQTALIDLDASGIQYLARELIEAHAKAAYERGPIDRKLSDQQIGGWRRLSTRLWLERAKRTIQSSLQLPD